MKIALSILATVAIAIPTIAIPARSQTLNESHKPLLVSQIDNPPMLLQCVQVQGQMGEDVNRDSPNAIISVGGRAFRPVTKAILSGTRQQTCSIERHSSTDKKSYAVAIPDDSNLLRMKVSILVDGQEKISRIMSRGEYRKFTFSLKGADSYSVIMTNVSGGYGSSGYIYFIPTDQ